MKKFRQATFQIKLDSSPKLTENENYLIATVYATRRGVFDYYQNDKLYREYRSEEEVFKVDSMNTLKHQPITRLHPQKMLSSKNSSQHIKGIVLEDVSREGDYIKATVKVMDQALIDEILTGKLTELSCGYNCEVVDKSGVTDRNEQYDGIQKNIVYNHLAVVPKGRAGANVRFKLDSEGNQDLSEEGYEENFDNDDNNEKGQEIEMKITFNGKEYDLAKADEKAKYDAAVQLDAQEKKDAQDKLAKAQVELDMLKADQANQPQKLAETLAFVAQVKPYLKADSTDEELVKKDRKELKKQAVIDNYPNITDIDKKDDAYYEVAYQFMLDNIKPKKDKAPAPQTPPAQKNDGLNNILNGKPNQNNLPNSNGSRTDTAETKLDEAEDPAEVAYLQSLKRDSEAWISK